MAVLTQARSLGRAGDCHMKDKGAATVYNTYTPGHKVMPRPGVKPKGKAAAAQAEAGETGLNQPCACSTAAASSRRRRRRRRRRRHCRHRLWFLVMSHQSSRRPPMTADGAVALMTTADGADMTAL